MKRGGAEMLLGIIILAISLSMDSLGIGISYGIRGIKISCKAKLTMCLISVAFTSIAVFFGNLLNSFMPEYLSKLIGAVMLIAFGIFIIFQSIYKKNKDKKLAVRNSNELIKNASNIINDSVKIIRNPICGDVDKSQDIDCIESIYLGIALSIDSFGAGISSVTSGLNSMFIPIVTAVCQYLFLSGGVFFGKRLSVLKNINSQIFVVISGVLLIILAMVRLQLA